MVEQNAHLICVRLKILHMTFIWGRGSGFAFFPPLFLLWNALDIPYAISTDNLTQRMTIPKVDLDSLSRAWAKSHF